MGSILSPAFMIRNDKKGDCLEMTIISSPATLTALSPAVKCLVLYRFSYLHFTLILSLYGRVRAMYLLSLKCSTKPKTEVFRCMTYPYVLTALIHDDICRERKPQERTKSFLEVGSRPK